MTESTARFSRPEELGRLIGQSPLFLKTIAKVPVIAESEASVLISGETGTGKELVAHAIHYLSPRAQFPFVAVNCGSLPDTLLEDELFGHERGAFTHAEARREGLIAQAENGTLFLDEVDTLACKAQVDLLRVLQDRKYRPIGSSREREAHVRIVAATNASLHQLLHSGNFRPDLYYRLCVFTLTLPPLRERKEDIQALAAHFLAKHAPAAKQGMQFSACAMEAMQLWDWPGNVRELENAVVRGIHLSQGSVIDAPDLVLALHPDNTVHMRAENQSFRSMKRATIEMFERDYLTKLMLTYNGNVSEAARASGKERRELGKLLKKHRLDAKSFRMQTGLQSTV